MPSNFKFRIIPVFLAILFAQAATALAGAFVAFSGQVNADGINVRVDATTGSAVVCNVSKGELVEVVAQVYDWYKIRLPKGAPSYVKGDLVECVNSDPTTNPGKCLAAKVIKDRINIRLGPSESTWILGKADKLTVLNILAEESGWYKIQPVYQSYGWVNKRFISKEIELSKKQETALPPSDGLLVIEGTVSPYGMVLWRQATHKLITSENKIYLLKGNRQGMNSLNYHKVRITGKLISLQADKYPVIEVNIIEALS